MRKSNSTFVVKNGIRKMRRSQTIRKFQNSYYVGLAYVGLVELEMYKKDNYTHGDGITEEYFYEGKATKATTIGDIDAIVYITVERFTANDRYGRDSYGSRRDVRDEFGADSMEYQNVSLWGENMEGMMQVTVKGSVSYNYQNIQGNETRLYHKKVQANSIEDCLDLISRASEEAWGEVTIKISEVEEANAVYREQAVAFPDTITLQTNEGELVLGKGYKEGKWTGEKAFNSSGIHCGVEATIWAVAFDEDGDDYTGGYNGLSRDAKVEYYAVRVEGTIVDENTQVSDVRNSPEQDKWERNFTGEGADTLEGAIAIAESNIAEVYQEYLDYVNSARNYQTIGHGVGHARTVENVNGWDYNFGDTPEDIRYDEWQSEEPTVTWDELPENHWGEPDAERKADLFLEEYTGVQGWYGRPLSPKFQSRGVYRIVSNGGEKADALMTRTREDVEATCRMTDCKLVEFTDGAHFTIAVDNRVSLSARKMAKSKKPRSFNAMVQSIREKNRQRK